MLSVLAASALMASAASAYAACGHQSAGIKLTVASAQTTPATDEEAASTFDPQTVKKPVETTVKKEAAE
jgi:ABC-type oligopeptide transport system substrate-binding subunit